MNAIFGWPLGWIMYFFYNIVPNYAVALLLFTLVSKLCLVPLSIKQQKGMIKTQLFQPKMAELQKKYGNNKQKLNEEMQKLYTEEGYNPMSGCLPLLIQFPIILGLYNVVQQPITHLIRPGADLITKAAQIAQPLLNNPKLDLLKSQNAQIEIIKQVELNRSAFSSLGELTDQIIALKSTMNIGPIDLTMQPSFSKFDALWLVPALSVVTSFFLSWLTTRQNGSSDNVAANNTQKTMMFMMPIMSGYLAFILPAGIGVYWIFSNIFAAIQAYILGKIMNPKEIADKMRADMEAQKQLEKEQKREARKKARESGAELDLNSAMSQKEINRIKLANARRRDAEKYGEEYVEVTDEDLK